VKRPSKAAHDFNSFCTCPECRRGWSESYERSEREVRPVRVAAGPVQHAAPGDDACDYAALEKAVMRERRERAASLMWR
jgi:hypothetical protein